MMDFVNIREAFAPLLARSPEELIFSTIVLTLWFLLYEETKKL